MKSGIRESGLDAAWRMERLLSVYAIPFKPASPSALVVDLSVWLGERRGLPEVGRHGFCCNRFSPLPLRDSVEERWK